VPIAILLAWQAGSTFGFIQANVLPAPSAVAEAFWRAARSGELWTNIEVSAGRAFWASLSVEASASRWAC
jgi:sulfonate transport system permease protein